MLQFQVGDKAVYPAQGVAEIIGIDEKEISGKIHRFYCLRILDSDMRILVPVDKAEQVGLREVVQEDQIQEVYDILREKEVHIDKQTWNRRYRGFMEKIKTGSLFEVAEVFRDLYRLKNQKTLSFGERRMLDTAKSLIVKELSVAKGTTEVKVERELEKIFNC
jgi:CarD family transcriptional regulator